MMISRSLFSSRRHFQLSIVLVMFLFLVVNADALADTYYNSSEPGCDGSDPTVLFCDDIEDGGWIETCEAGNASCCTNDPVCQANGAGFANPNNDGWKGNGFTSWPDPQGTSWARCGGLGVGRHGLRGYQWFHTC